MRSRALLARLQEAESELERLKAAAKVVDISAIMAAVDAALAEYREQVANIGSKTPIDIGQAREIIRGVVDRIPIRPGADGVPVAELSLNEAMPLAGIAVGSDVSFRI